MKKLAILLVIFAMLFSTCMVPVFATETEDALADYLVVFYDFEGDTLEEQLSDKATAGKSKENLTLHSTQDENGVDLTYVSNGIAHISDEGQNYFDCQFDSTTGVGSDIYGITSEMTMFIIYQPSGAPTAYGDFMDIKNVIRCYAEAASENQLTSKIGLRTTSDAYNSATHRVGLADNIVYLGIDTVYFAVTTKYDAEAKTLDVTANISYDGGKTYTASNKSFTDIDVYYSNSPYLSLGKTISYAHADRDAIFDIDEVRIYNKALSTEELIGLSITPATPTTPNDSTTPDDSATPDDPTTPSDPATPDDDAEKNTLQQTEPVTKAPAATTNAPVSEEEAGCASVTGASGIGMIVLGLGACLMTKKRRR